MSGREVPVMHKEADVVLLDVGDVFKLPSGKVRYVVEAAVLDGGGTGHGPHDIYPDGWHIYARALGPNNTYNPKGKEIDFWQTGCFSDMRPNLIPEGRIPKSVKVVVKYGKYRPYPQGAF